MPVHGRIEVKDFRDNDRGIILCTRRAGMLTEDVTDLLKLPFIMFHRAKQDCNAPRHRFGNILNMNYRNGPDYFLHAIHHAAANRRMDYLGFVDWWRSIDAASFGVAALANWIVGMEFDKWRVVPSLRWCGSKAKFPEILIEADPDEQAYAVMVPAYAAGAHSVEDIRQAEDHYNTVMKTLEALVTGVNREPFFVKDDCEHGPFRITVRYAEIARWMMWTEICTLRAEGKL